jgi:hypothetical protein
MGIALIVIGTRRPSNPGGTAPLGTAAPSAA